MKIALDPTPFHHDHALLDFPRVVADLGYEYLQLTPHRDFIPFFNHPRADDELVAQFRKVCADAGVGIASVLPVLRWSGPDENAREAAASNSASPKTSNPTCRDLPAWARAKPREAVFVRNTPTFDVQERSLAQD